MKALFLNLLLITLPFGIYAQQIDSDKESTSRNSMKDIRKNSINAETLWFLPGIYFERVFPVNNKVGIIGKVGATYYSNPIFDAELGGLFGKSRHFLEANILTFNELTDRYYGGHIGYRYVGKKGLILKGGFMYWGEYLGEIDSKFPRVGIGYSF